MEKIYLSIAGFNIVCVLKPTDHAYSKEKFKKMLWDNYREFILKTPKKADFTIVIYSLGVLYFDIKQKSNLEEHYSLLFSIDKKRKKIHLHNPVNEFEFEFILSYILNSYLLPINKGFSLHGSSVSYKDKAFIFEGVSGAGKSTTAALLNGLCTMLSDDSLIIRKKEGKFYAYQNLIHEKNWYFKRGPSAYSIDKVFFVKKAKTCGLKEIYNKEVVLNIFFKQIIGKEENLIKQFSAITEFVNENKFYYLYVKKDSGVFKKYFKKNIL